MKCGPLSFSRYEMRTGSDLEEIKQSQVLVHLGNLIQKITHPIAVQNIHSWQPHEVEKKARLHASVVAVILRIGAMPKASADIIKGVLFGDGRKEPRLGDYKAVIPKLY